jgi:hypothetical protein
MTLSANSAEVVQSPTLKASRARLNPSSALDMSGSCFFGGAVVTVGAESGTVDI